MRGVTRETWQRQNGPGAFSARTVFLFWLLGVGLSGGCTPVGRPSGPVPLPGSYPAVRGGKVAPGEAALVEDLLGQARDSLAMGAAAGTVDLALEVLRDHPTAEGSAEALLLLAQGHLALGHPLEAAEAALELARVVGAGHPAYPHALVLGGEALEKAGRGEEAVGLLLHLPPSISSSLASRARDVLQKALEGASSPVLRRLSQEISPDSPLRGAFFAQASVGAYRRGERAEAEEWARQALQGTGISAEDAALARGVLEGRLEELLGEPFVVGIILSRSGAAVSPRQVRWGEELLEGARLAVETRQRPLKRPVRLEVLDDGGTPEGARAAVEGLERMGAVAALGPVDPVLVRVMTEGRRGPLPLLVPARLVDDEVPERVLSLSGVPGDGAKALARYALRNGWRRAAILRPATRPEEVEARAFREEMVQGGGSVAEELPFDPHATFFQQELRRLAALRPQAVFLPLRPGDIPLVAPQITFFGLDTLGVKFLGGEAWTEREVLDQVDPRHTDGVVAVAGPVALEDTPAVSAFRETYERFFQRSLRSLGPAWGYDGLSLILEALAQGARTAEEVWEVLGTFRDFPGATGRLSVEGSHVRRPPLLVEIRDRRPIPILLPPR